MNELSYEVWSRHPAVLQILCKTEKSFEVNRPKPRAIDSTFREEAQQAIKQIFMPQIEEYKEVMSSPRVSMAALPAVPIT